MRKQKLKEKKVCFFFYLSAVLDQHIFQQDEMLFVFIGKNTDKLDKQQTAIRSHMFAFQRLTGTITLTRPVPPRITTPLVPTHPEDLSRQTK